LPASPCSPLLVWKKPEPGYQFDIRAAYLKPPLNNNISTIFRLTLSPSKKFE
jgi:hypothetical protein